MESLKATFTGREQFQIRKLHGKKLARGNWTRAVLTVLAALLLSGVSFGQGVGISESTITPDPSSILELRSSERGFLVPRMTTVERNAIGSPVNGLLIYNTSQSKLNIYNSTLGTWLVITQSAGDPNGNGFILVGDGTNLNSVDLSGDIDIDNTGNAQIQPDVVTATEIATGAVGSDEIIDNSIAAIDIGTDAVDSDEIAADAVGSSEIATGAVTTTEILDGTIANIDLDKTNIPLSGFGAAGAAVDLGSQQINNLADPTLAQDAATKNYVDNSVDSENDLAQGSIWVGDGTGNQGAVDASQDGYMLVGDGTTLNSVDIGGDIDVDNLGDAQIQADAVTTAEVALNTLVADDIATGAVTTDEILNETILSEDISDGTITVDDIGSGAVGSDEIIDNSIAAIDIGTDAVDSDEIAADAVGSSEIATGAVTTTEILDGTIANIDLDKTNIPLSGFGAAGAAVDLGSQQINNLADPTLAQDAATKNYVDNSVDSENDLAQGSIWVGDGTGNQGAVDASQDGYMLVGDGTTLNSVDIGGDIDVDNLGDAQIQADAVTTAEVALNTLVADDIATGAVTTDEILNETILSEDISDGTITVDDIGSGAVGSDEIIDNSIAAIDIGTDAVDSDEIAADAVGNDEIAADAVGSSEIATGAVTTTEISDGTIVDADVDAAAAIQGTKIDPDFGAQNILTTGTLNAGATSVTGNITVTGTVDGRDVGTDGSNQDDIQSLTGVGAGSTDLGTFTGSTIADNATIYEALEDLEVAAEGGLDIDLTEAYTNGNDLVTSGGNNVIISGTEALNITAAGGLIANTADINGGTLDGTVIGGTSSAAATVTDLTATGTVDLGVGAIQSGEITDGTITVDDIGTGAVGSDEIIDNSIAAIDIGTDAVDSDEIAADAVGSSEIATGAVTTTEISDGTIVDADVDAAAAIQGTKIDPDFGAQNILTTGTLNAGATSVTGNITVTGTVDGRDVGTDGSNQDDIQSLTGVGAGSTDLGTFTGSTIADNATIYEALEDLEVAAEGGLDIDLTEAYTNGNDLVTSGGNNVIISGTEALNITAAGGLIANTADINGGTLDGTVIGGTSSAAATVTDLTATGTVDLGVGAIQSGEITDGTITVDDIGTDAVDSDEIAADAVGSSEIATGAVTTTEISDGTIVDADVDAAAAIQGTKIDPDFGAQNILTTGTLNAGATSVTGNITVTGTVDGRDVGTDGSNQDDIQSLTGVGAGSTDLGTFTGSTIADNATIYEALEDLEVAAEGGLDIDLTEAYTNGNDLVTSGGNNVIISGTEALNITAAGGLIANTADINGGTLDGTVIGGTSSAAATVTDLTATGTVDLGVGAIQSGEITDGTITVDDIGTGAVGSDEIIDNSIAAIDIGTDAVDSDEIAADAVGNDEIAADAVGSSEIATGAVTTTEISDGTIVDADVDAAAAIQGTKIDPDFGAQNILTTGTLNAGATSVTGNITVTGTVDGRDVGTDGSNQDDIQSLTGVGAGSTDLGTFTGSTIADNATIYEALEDLEVAAEGGLDIDLTEAYTNGNDLVTSGGNNVIISGTEALNITAAGGLIANTADINGGTLDGTVIGGTSSAAATVTDLTATGTVDLGVGAIQSGEITDGTITVDDIGTGAVGSDEIIDNSIAAIDIGTDAVDSDEIAADAVGSSEISNGTILNEDIANGTIDLSTKTTGTLSTGNGGTGQTTYTDGQLLIGNSGGTLTKSTLIAGSGISITNGSGSIEISSLAETSSKIVSADLPWSSNMMTPVTDMNFAIGVNETWSFEFNLQVGTGTGGVEFEITFPAGGAMRTVVTGAGSNANNITSEILTGSGSPTSSGFSANFANGWVRITGVVSNGGTAGTVQLRFASSTNLQTSTIYQYSYMTARRVN